MRRAWKLVGVEDSGAGVGALVPPGEALVVVAEALAAPALSVAPPEVITAVDVAPSTSTTVIAITTRSPAPLPGKSGLRSPSRRDTISAHATSAPPAM